MKWSQLTKLAKELPEVEEDLWYGTPALKVRGKGFARLRDADVVFVLEDVEEQEVLCENQPAIYYITDHYKGYAAVLARLSKLTVKEARLRLERAWRVKAPKSLLRSIS
jgi:hypothetical protein